jgi:PIN domain nuclease of toxin-antitoxin system
MRYLADTQILIWVAYEQQRLSAKARKLLLSEDCSLSFSIVSLWEVGLKRSKVRNDFQWDSRPLRDGLLANDFHELNLTGPHVLAFNITAPTHRDPFDRLLVAQASVEGMLLMTADHVLGRQSGPIEFVG